MEQHDSLDQAPWEVDHIGIAVTNLEAAIAHYAITAGATVSLQETLVEQGVELAFLNTGGSKLELLSPLSATSTLAKFISKRGSGLHHVCYRVTNINAELARLTAAGLQLIDHTPRHGAGGTKIAFISPRSFLGVLTELCEYPAP